MIIETNTHFFNYEIGADSIQWIEKRNLGRIGRGKKYADTSFVYEDMTDYEKEWAVNPFVGEPGVIVQELDGDPSSLVQTIKVPNGSLTISGTTATLVFSTSVEAHADSHVDGTDDVQSATAAQKGLATAAQITKLDGIESSATADQSAVEIKTAYETNADTNAYNDAAVSKLDGIEASATADQTGAEIKTAYELEADTNAYSDAAVSKLGGIEALADVTSTHETSHATVLVDADIGGSVLAQQTIGIADNNLVEVDGPGAGAPATGEYAKWTTTGLEGKTTVELLSDIGVAAGADVTSTNETSHADVLIDGDFNAKGDLLSASADDTPLILTVGANDLVLTAASGEATGLKWAAAAGGGSDDFAFFMGG